MSKALQTESEPSKLDEHVSDLPDMAAKPKTPATLTSSTTSATPITTNTAARNKSTALPEILMYNDKDIAINPTRKQEIEKNIHAGVRQILEAHTSYATITQSELDKAYADVKSQKVNLDQLSKNCSDQVDELTRLRTGIAVLEEANSQHDAAIAQRDDKIHNLRGDITRNLTVIQQLDDKVSILKEEKMQKLATIEQQSGNVRSLEERINMLELEVEKAREVTSPSSGMVHPHDVLKLLETQRKTLDMEILPNELAKIKKQHEQALARLEAQNEEQQEHAELFAEEETQSSPLSAPPAISIPDGTPLSDLFAKVNLSDERFNTVPAIVPGSAYPRVMRNAGMKAAKTIHQVTIEDKTYSERLYYQAVKFDVLGEKQDCEIKLGGKVFERYKDAADGKETLVSKVELSRVKLFKSDLFVEWAVRKEIDEKDMY
ncbi:hypothetical protein B0J14DRAFT_580376 [Halenospora varia]|nr:hypothetical protein B0J14DRAFT_580376 [Halenospora varia]